MVKPSKTKVDYDVFKFWQLFTAGMIGMYLSRSEGGMLGFAWSVGLVIIIAGLTYAFTKLSIKFEDRYC